MDTKLTLKLDEHVIERAKKYASQKKTSLSKLIENYLDSLTSEHSDGLEISPFVKSISSGNRITSNINYQREREEYIDFLDKKYQ